MAIYLESGRITECFIVVVVVVLSSVKKLVKDVFSSCHERGTKKMLSFQEESNHRLSGSALRCSTTEPQRLHGEQSPLRSSCKASRNRGLSSYQEFKVGRRKQTVNAGKASDKQYHLQLII